MDTVESLLAKRVQSKGIDYSLTRLQRMLDAMGNPERKLAPIIHVAGTNGKGSTITFLAQLLRDQGYQVAQYHSPHLVCYNERFIHNGHPISDEDLLAYYTQVSSHPLQETLTEFELLTVMAICYFKAINPDFICLETGLGGRLDATNVITPILSIITRIDKDHEALLGTTLAKIATEKAGIIKARVPVISLRQHSEVNPIIEHAATSLDAPLTWVKPLDQLPEHMHLSAPYQKENAALAIEALQHLSLSAIPSNKAIQDSLKHATFSGRFAIYHHNKQAIMVDGAHNVSGANALADAIRHHYPKQPVTLLIGALKRKPLQDILTILTPLCDTIYLCDFQPNESYTPEDAQAFTSLHIRTFTLGDPLPQNSPLVITGSLYFLGALMRLPTYVNMLQLP